MEKLIASTIITLFGLGISVMLFRFSSKSHSGEAAVGYGFAGFAILVASFIFFSAMMF